MWFSWACFGKRGWDVPVACDNRQCRSGWVEWGEAVPGIIKFVLIVLLPFFCCALQSHKTPQNEHIWGRSCSRDAQHGWRKDVYSAEAPGIQGVWLQCRQSCWNPGVKLRNWCWSCCVNPGAPSCGGSCAGQSCSLRTGSWGCRDCPAPQLESVCPLPLLWGF